MVNEIRPYKMDQTLRWGGTEDDYSAWEAYIESTKKYLKYPDETYLEDVENALLKYGDFDK